MMSTKKIVVFAAILLVLTACQLARPFAKDQAATMVVQTDEAASTIIPSTIAPTQTTAPTETPRPTVTITPTPAPTLTPTQSGPLVIKDDFSTKLDIWGNCNKCEWKNGELFLGPYAPNGNGINQIFGIICQACGEHAYFHIAADLTFAEGVGGDREFGVGLLNPGKFFAGTGMATSQFARLEAFDITTGRGTGKFQRYGAIKPGAITNRVEFTAKPNSSGGTDYFATINGKVLIFLTDYFDSSVKGLKPAIYLGWHSIGIKVDNFEYEELVP